jgi:hypothetical protein
MWFRRNTGANAFSRSDLERASAARLAAARTKTLQSRRRDGWVFVEAGLSAAGTLFARLRPACFGAPGCRPLTGHLCGRALAGQA